MTRKNQEDRRSHLLEMYRRIQRQKKGLSKKGQGFRVLKKTKRDAKTEAKPEAKRTARIPAARPVEDTKAEVFISVMKPAAQFS